MIIWFGPGTIRRALGGRFVLEQQARGVFFFFWGGGFVEYVWRTWLHQAGVFIVESEGKAARWNTEYGINSYWGLGGNCYFGESSWR